jgi:hypothetical protein
VFAKDPINSFQVAQNRDASLPRPRGAPGHPTHQDFSCADGSVKSNDCLGVWLRRVDELSRATGAHLTVQVAASGCQQHQLIRHAPLHGVRRSRLGLLSTCCCTAAGQDAAARAASQGFPKRPRPRLLTLPLSGKGSPGGGPRHGASSPQPTLCNAVPWLAAQKERLSSVRDVSPATANSP